MSAAVRKNNPNIFPFRYGSVCSGIKAASVAWEPLGWRPSFFSEIDAFPRAVLAHRFPDVPLHGDFTTIEDGQCRGFGDHVELEDDAE